MVGKMPPPPPPQKPSHLASTPVTTGISPTPTSSTSSDMPPRPMSMEQRKSFLFSDLEKLQSSGNPISPTPASATLQKQQPLAASSPSSVAIDGPKIPARSPAAKAAALAAQQHNTSLSQVTSSSTSFSSASTISPSRPGSFAAVGGRPVFPAGLGPSISPSPSNSSTSSSSLPRMMGAPGLPKPRRDGSSSDTSPSGSQSSGSIISTPTPPPRPNTQPAESMIPPQNSPSPASVSIPNRPTLPPRVNTVTYPPNNSQASRPRYAQLPTHSPSPSPTSPPPNSVYTLGSNRSAIPPRPSPMTPPHRPPKKGESAVPPFAAYNQALGSSSSGGGGTGNAPVSYTYAGYRPGPPGAPGHMIPPSSSSAHAHPYTHGHSLPGFHEPLNDEDSDEQDLERRRRQNHRRSGAHLAPAVMINNPRTATVRRNWVSHLIGNFGSISKSSKILLILTSMIMVAEIVTTSFVLFIAHGSTCDRPLDLYLSVYVVRVAICLPLVIYQYLHPSEDTGFGTPRPDIRINHAISQWVDRAKWTLDAFGTIWFVVGNWWVFTTTECSKTSPLIFYLSVIFITMGYFIMLIPILLYEVIKGIPVVRFRRKGKKRHSGYSDPLFATAAVPLIEGAGMGITGENVLRRGSVFHHGNASGFSGGAVVPANNGGMEGGSGAGDGEAATGAGVSTALLPKKMMMNGNMMKGDGTSDMVDVSLDDAAGKDSSLLGVGEKTGDAGSMKSEESANGLNRIPEDVVASLSSHSVIAMDGEPPMLIHRRTSVSGASSSTASGTIGNSVEVAAGVVGAASPAKPPKPIRRTSLVGPPPIPSAGTAVGVSSSASTVSGGSQGGESMGGGSSHGHSHSHGHPPVSVNMPSVLGSGPPPLPPPPQLPLASASFSSNQNSYSHSYANSQSQSQSQSQQSQSQHMYPPPPPVIRRPLKTDAEGVGELELDDEDAVCVICLNSYEEGEKLRRLVCYHHFHLRCVDEWLRLNKTCPLCVRDVTVYMPVNQEPPPSDPGSGRTVAFTTGPVHRTFRRVVLGLVALIVPGVLIYQEYSHKELALAMKEASKILKPLPSDTITDPSSLKANVGSLVQVSSTNVDPELITDLDFNLEFPGAVRVKRVAEYCQWVETITEERREYRDENGQEKTDHIRHYNYYKTWNSHPISSIFYDQPVAHHNPSRDPFPSSDHTTSQAKFGDFKVRSEVLSRASPFAVKKSYSNAALEDFANSYAYQLNGGPEGFRYIGNGYFYSAYSASLFENIAKLAGRVLEGSLDIQLGDLFKICEAGDIRIRYEAVVVPVKGATVIGKLLNTKGEIGVYTTTRGYQIGLYSHDASTPASDIFRSQIRDSRFWLILARLVVIPWAAIVTYSLMYPTSADAVYRTGPLENSRYILASMGLASLVLGAAGLLVAGPAGVSWPLGFTGMGLLCLAGADSRVFFQLVEKVSGTAGASGESRPASSSSAGASTAHGFDDKKKK
ncbi:hypothetical protein HDU76_002546 [Blyttiomyces sp. JEL0837]|nr:hypothetical protein HDU76_002546 [Blyttiomyces sp. JEL0837]